VILPLKNETLHSLLIRQALIENGSLRLKELKGVISYSGYWYNFPKVGPNSFLAEYPENLVYEFILERLPAAGSYYRLNNVDISSIYNNLISSDSFFVDEFVLGNCNVWQTPVRFCSMCFKDQTYKYGICYFEFSWYRAYKCLKHSMNLTQVKSKRGSNVYSELQRAMTLFC